MQFKKSADDDIATFLIEINKLSEMNNNTSN